MNGLGFYSAHVWEAKQFALYHEIHSLLLSFGQIRSRNPNWAILYFWLCKLLFPVI